jgi:hypothetical protein
MWLGNPPCECDEGMANYDTAILVDYCLRLSPTSRAQTPSTKLISAFTPAEGQTRSYICQITLPRSPSYSKRIKTSIQRDLHPHSPHPLSFLSRAYLSHDIVYDAYPFPPLETPRNTFAPKCMWRYGPKPRAEASDVSWELCQRMVIFCSIANIKAR